VNVAPAAAPAVSSTTVGLAKLAEHVEPQLMPAGADVIVPPAAPAPARLTSSANCADSVKVAVTVFAASTVTVQPALPEHPPPDQLAKVEPAVGVACNVTVVPEAKLALQLTPQLMDGEAGDVLATVPAPVPAFATVSRNEGGVNVAVTAAVALMGTPMTQGPGPVHAPLQPVNVAPPVGVAERVTSVPAA